MLKGTAVKPETEGELAHGEQGSGDDKCAGLHRASLLFEMYTFHSLRMQDAHANVRDAPVSQAQHPACCVSLHDPCSCHNHHAVFDDQCVSMRAIR